MLDFRTTRGHPGEGHGRRTARDARRTNGGARKTNHNRHSAGSDGSSFEYTIVAARLLRLPIEKTEKDRLGK
ncbi:hypothetical protein GWI33_016528 [Rhynchophorus ferrugineus]|uniref:Uncharacterized protein n=1 Tax=Rhynchophorus ferrugineus TaxID=354439 RepID=A0A834M4X2_RHYFE|nr:hypothetical protein GWI33_016528 [Rhynchophorus ferrugineus]